MVMDNTNNKIKLRRTNHAKSLEGYFRLRKLLQRPPESALRLNSGLGEQRGRMVREEGRQGQGKPLSHLQMQVASH